MQLIMYKLYLVLLLYRVSRAVSEGVVYGTEDGDWPDTTGRRPGSGTVSPGDNKEKQPSRCVCKVVNCLSLYSHVYLQT